MKCIVTGHTNGIGKSIYNHFISKGFEVKGMSRSNGYDINNDFDKIIDQANQCDIFVNCACSKNGQLNLLNSLYTQVGNMIVLGSVSADYSRLDIEYENKLQLENQCKKLSKNSDKNVCNILYLKLSFCENATLPIKVDSKYITTFSEINDVIDLWLKIPKIFSIEFTLKETLELKNFAEKSYQTT